MAGRGIDFAQADAVFVGPVAEIEDTTRCSTACARLAPAGKAD
jgi:hypothetical protein